MAPRFASLAALLAGAHAQSHGAAVWEDTVNLVQQHASHSGGETFDKLSMGSTGYWCITDINPGVVQCDGPDLSCVKCVNKYFQCIEGYVPVLDYFGAMKCATGQKRAECLKNGCKPGGCCEQTCCPPQPTAEAFKTNPRLATAINISKSVADFLNVTKDIEFLRNRRSNLVAKQATIKRRKDTYEAMKKMQMEQREWEIEQLNKLEKLQDEHRLREQKKQKEAEKEEELRSMLQKAMKKGDEATARKIVEVLKMRKQVKEGEDGAKIAEEHLRQKKALEEHLKNGQTQHEDKMKMMKAHMGGRREARVEKMRLEKQKKEDHSWSATHASRMKTSKALHTSHLAKKSNATLDNATLERRLAIAKRFNATLTKPIVPSVSTVHSAVETADATPTKPIVPSVSTVHSAVETADATPTKPIVPSVSTVHSAVETADATPTKPIVPSVSAVHSAVKKADATPTKPIVPSVSTVHSAIEIADATPTKPIVPSVSTVHSAVKKADATPTKHIVPSVSAVHSAAKTAHTTPTKHIVPSVSTVHSAVKRADATPTKHIVPSVSTVHSAIKKAGATPTKRSVPSVSTVHSAAKTSSATPTKPSVPSVAAKSSHKHLKHASQEHTSSTPSRHSA